MLTGVPAGAALKWPSLAFNRDTLFVAGNIVPTGVDGPAQVQPQPLLVLRTPGGSIGKPEGQFTFMYPRGVFGGDGKYHLFWGEPDSVPSGAPDHWPPTGVRSVWHAWYAGGWSKPERLLSEFQVSWSYRGDLVTVDQTGRIHLALAVLRRRGGYALTYLRQSPSTWERTDTRIPLANSGSVLVLGPDSLLVAYVGFASDTAHDGARVRLVFTGDGGRTWHAPPRLPGSGRDPDSPLLSRSADGALHVVWWEPGGRGGFSAGQVFRAASSADGGATWTDNGALPVSGMLGSAAVLTGLCSGTGVLVEATDGQSVWVSQLVFGPQLSSRRLFPSQWGNTDPGVAVHGNRLVLVWSSIRHLPERLAPWAAEANVCRER